MFKNHPKGLLTAALSNMGERFGYYIMNAVLVLFLCSNFERSRQWYHLFLFLRRHLHFKPCRRSYC